VLVQTPKIFAAVSVMIGMDIRKSVFDLGIVGVENPFTKGKINAPRRNPE
jgi:hypothetical protein